MTTERCQRYAERKKPAAFSCNTFVSRPSAITFHISHFIFRFESFNCEREVPEALNLIGNDYVQDESEEARRSHTELKKNKNNLKKREIGTEGRSTNGAVRCGEYGGRVGGDDSWFGDERECVWW